MSLSKDGAARRALVSSGVVGLTTALLVKVFGVDMEVSLPIGVASAVSLDYLVNVQSFANFMPKTSIVYQKTKLTT